LTTGELPSQEPIAGEKDRVSHESELASILEEQRKISLSREGLYSFLSRAFLFEVDKEFLTMVVAAQPIIEELASSQHGSMLRKASEELASVSSKAAAVVGVEKKKLLTDLAIEYANLFLGTGISAGREQAWPWESAYFSFPPRKQAQPYHEVCDAYRIAGYQKPKDYNEPEDHIALELDFMAYLSRLTTTSIDEGKVDFALGYVKLQKEFMKDHLLRWTDKFSKRLLSKSEKRETDFYHALAMMLESFVALDDQTLDDIAAKFKEICAKQEASASAVDVEPSTTNSGHWS
jgi:putative dimethyl sulfoxide reductase chaperone